MNLIRRSKKPTDLTANSTHTDSPLNEIGDVSAVAQMFERLRQQNAQYDQAIAALVSANRISNGWDKPAEPEMTLTIQREVLVALGDTEALAKFNQEHQQQLAQEQAERFGADIRYEDVTALELEGEVKRVTTDDGVYETRTVIISTGSEYRRLGVDGEERLSGHGVSYCATCDGAFFKGKTTAVVGGGDVALEDALFLARLCKKVYLIHRRDELRADKILQEKLFACENVEIIWDTVPLAIEGENKVTALKIQNKKTGEEQQRRGDLGARAAC